MALDLERAPDVILFHMNSKLYTIKEASRRSGVSIDTLRYYERIGLMPSVQRAENGHRRFTDMDLGWLHLLNLLRNTVMSIRQMLHFVNLEQEGSTALPKQVEMLEKHRTVLFQHIQEMETSIGVLDEKIKYYSALAKQVPKALPADLPPRRKSPSVNRTPRVRVSTK